MKVIKPFTLGYLGRPWPDPPKHYLSLAATGFFDLLDPDTFLTDQAMWPFVALAMPPATPLDMAMPKVRGEVMVFGSAMPPGGQPVQAAAVEFSIGRITKRAIVHGDRYWKLGTAGLHATPAKPFTEMPIGFERAFGGPNFPRNPTGLGHDAEKLTRAGEVVALPNVEHPAHPILSPSDAPEPYGFGMINVAWPQRMGLVGTTDLNWVRTRFPAMPVDQDPHIHNAAPPDQWIDRFWRGDEDYLVKGMHPDHPVLRGRLPGVRARCFVHQETVAGLALREASLRPETVYLFPSALRGIVIYRGSVESTLDGMNVKRVMLAYERLADPPRPFDHYAEVFRLRTDPKTIAQNTFRESQLTPAVTPAALADREAERAEYAAMTLAKQKRRARHNIEKSGGTISDEDLDKAVQPSGLPVITPGDIARRDIDIGGMMEGADRLMARKSAEVSALIDQRAKDVDRMTRTMAELRTLLTSPDLGAETLPISDSASGPRIDEGLGQMLAGARREVAHLPPAEARGVMDKIKQGLAQGASNLDNPAAVQANAQAPRLGETIERVIADLTLQAKAAAPADRPAIEAALQKVQVIGQGVVENIPSHEIVAAAVREGAHAPRLTKGELEEKVPAALKNAESVVLAQGKVDEAKALQEAQRSLKTIPAEATPPPALPALPKHLPTEAEREEALRSARQSFRRQSTRPIFGKASLEAAALVALRQEVQRRQAAREPLAGMDLAGIDFSESDLRGAALAGCFFEHANLRGADLSRADLTEAVFPGADLTGARLDGCVLVKANLSSAVLAEASLRAVHLENVQLNGVDARGADLSGLSLKSAIVFGADLRAANFSHARLTSVLFVRCQLDGVQFDHADLERVGFVECGIGGARGRKSRLYRCAFLKTKAAAIDLTEADLRRFSAIGDNDLTSAVLVRADGRNSTWNQSDLRGANFAHGNFDEACFGDSKLGRSSFYSTSLKRAMFLASDCTEADFADSNLQFANLRRAVFVGAELRHASLYGAETTGTDFRLSDLTRSNLRMTVFERG